MTFRLGDVVLIRMQFHQASGSKIRPALVLLDSGDDDFIAAPITSRPIVSEHDLALVRWTAAGLNVASSVRIHKLTVLSKADVARRLGSLAEVDRESLIEALCRSFCPRSGGK